ncbi:HNH endonuclease signature motif containing protein [Virgibacillus siamensis]|uniref:HNH endonuclease signature motif containing protein n=1 Tax=Virgibacillus siamensis TaxID=480071 RepID=UPI000985C129|nr:HNH endonuclease signature motif containing protein [Virgibacillus siamensis]
MNKYMYECIKCNEIFKSYNPKPKYCSKKCKDEYSKQKIKTDEIKRLYKEGHTQLEIATKLGATQKIIYSRMKEEGIKARTPKKRNQFGKNNSYWKNGIIKDKGYVLEKTPGHPRASKVGDYVYQHVLIMERHLGRRLNWNGADNPDSEIVHHKNEIKDDNRLENLELMTISEHTRHHNEIRNRKGVV